MQRKRNICVVTGSRAEYGLLVPLLKVLEAERTFNLQITATGMHLSPEFGLTYKEILADGFHINEKVELLLSSDSRVGISKSMGLGCIGFAEAYERLNPDTLVVLGDRFEVFIAASVANVLRIPIAHVHGGEITQGAFDEAFRHSVTKMSNLHFTSTAEYRRRVIQLGEHPSRVFNVGALGLDNIRTLSVIGREELEKTLGFKFRKRNILVTLHPATNETEPARKQCGELFGALSALPNTQVIFTKANADPGGRVINSLVDQFVAEDPSSRVVFTSLGRLRYLSLLKHVDVVVGNSSSGIIEVPSFKVGTVNVGSRQKGRVKGSTVIDCRPARNDILQAIEMACSDRFRSVLRRSKNPYGNGNSAERICSILKRFGPTIHEVKSFYDIP